MPRVDFLLHREIYRLRQNWKPNLGPWNRSVESGPRKISISRNPIAVRISIFFIFSTFQWALLVRQPLSLRTSPPSSPFPLRFIGSASKPPDRSSLSSETLAFVRNAVFQQTLVFESARRPRLVRVLFSLFLFLNCMSVRGYVLCRTFFYGCLVAEKLSGRGENWDWYRLCLVTVLSVLFGLVCWIFTLW